MTKQNNENPTEEITENVKNSSKPASENKEVLKKTRAKRTPKAKTTPLNSVSTPIEATPELVKEEEVSMKLEEKSISQHADLKNQLTEALAKKKAYQTKIEKLENEISQQKKARKALKIESKLISKQIKKMQKKAERSKA
jgi:hypothetical protein